MKGRVLRKDSYRQRVDSTRALPAVRQGSKQ